MFSKGEASQIRQEFWTAFGKYMAPIKGADGGRVNWINYKTGEKDVFFRMHANADESTISIDLTHKDEGVQQIYFEQFLDLQKELHEVLREEWEWKLHQKEVGGKTISCISISQTGVSIFRKEDWPQMISFFKQRIIALDAFWSEARYYIESLH